MPTDRLGDTNGKQLLRTKLHAPRAATDGILRPRLLRELERGADGKLTLAATPPGYGKSTLFNQWQQWTDRASAWISLDDGDNDFLTFMEYVVAAIQSIDPAMCRETFGALQSPSVQSTHEIIHSLINEVSESTRPFVLILDDYHVLTSQEVQSAVLQVLQRMPSNMSLMITSRKDPNFPTLRMSARGELVELGLRDLGFDAAEAEEFLVQRHGLRLSPSDLARIDEWAEGWPVAYRLLAGSMRGRSSEQLRGRLDALTEDVPLVSDYLWDEVIERQTEDRQAFLLQTSILRQFNPELAFAVTGDEHAAAHIESLEIDNLFIARLDGPGNWHRYHHIFSDVLRRRLSRSRTDEDVRAHHQRAAAWYSQHDLLAEAAHHAMQANDWDLGARLLVNISSELYAQERVGALYRLLRDVPDEPLRAEPRLAYWLAWAQVRTGHPREAFRMISLAKSAATDATDPEILQAAQQLRLLTALFAWDSESGEIAARELLDTLTEDDIPDRVRALVMLGMVRETGGDLSAAADALDEARRLAGRLGNRGLQVAALSASGILELSMGKLEEPAKIFQRVIVLGEEWNDLPLQNAYLKLASILYEWNRLDEAAEQANIAQELAERMGAPFHMSQIAMLHAIIAAARDDWGRALELIENAITASVDAGYVGTVPVLEALRSRIYLRSGQLIQAQGWLHRREVDLIGSLRYQDVTSVLTAYRIRFAEGRGGDVAQPLEQLASHAREQGWFKSLIPIQMLRAMIALESGDDGAATAAIDEAVGLGSREGFRRSYLDKGPQAIPALNLAAREGGPHRQYARTVLEASGVVTVPDLPQPSLTPSILSPRERDVMRLVANGLSNRDIGDTLFISEETVKTHLRRIFEKLEVSSRTQAIHRSQQLELL